MAEMPLRSAGPKLLLIFQGCPEKNSEKHGGDHVGLHGYSLYSDTFIDFQAPKGNLLSLQESHTRLDVE